MGEVTAGDLDERWQQRSPLRRRVRIPALFTVVLGLPWLIASVVVIFLVGSLLGSSVAPLLIAFWLLSGAAVLLEPVERVVIRRVFGFRWPTSAEQQLVF
jgi:hypothetical protein